MAEDSYNPKSIDVDDDFDSDHISRLFPAAPTFLTERIARQQTIRCERLLKARVAHNIAIASKTCSAGRHCLASLQASKLVNPNNQVGVKIRPPTYPSSVPMPLVQAFPAEFECQLCFQVINLFHPY
jgi:hypothetical protein